MATDSLLQSTQLLRADREKMSLEGAKFRVVSGDLGPSCVRWKAGKPLMIARDGSPRKQGSVTRSSSQILNSFCLCGHNRNETRNLNSQIHNKN